MKPPYHAQVWEYPPRGPTTIAMKPPYHAQVWDYPP